jgi:hypothetical protein
MSEFARNQNRTVDNSLLRPANPERTAAEPAHEVNPQPWGNQAARQFAETCPLRLPSPGVCPFGGACHACPARVQPKLAISRPDDPYEQEADRVAEQVMAMPEPKAQRACPSCEDDTLQKKPLADQITPLIQRQEEQPEEEEEEETVQAKAEDGAVQRQEEQPEEEEEPVQAKAEDSAIQRQEENPEEEEEPVQAKRENISSQGVSTAAERHINMLQSAGSPLSQTTRDFFEPRFGRSFENVRVHTGPSANELAESANAQAFTLGRDIVFGKGRFAPESQSGRRLLAHELTHILHQRNLNEDLAQRAPAPHIQDIYVDQTTQSVYWTYTDGTRSENHECSTGAGLCGRDCSNPASGSACTSMGTFTVCSRVTHPHYHYWIGFDCTRAIAFHYYPDVDGCPWSHGCVRLHDDAAHLIYQGARVGTTQVHVTGTPNLRRCWTNSTGGTCWVRDRNNPNQRTQQRCARFDCFPLGDFPLPDMSTRYA